MAIIKRRGTKSSAQDNFIGPNPVTNLVATNVGSGRAFNNGRIDLSWTNPSTGNTPTGYKIIRGGSQIATVNHPNNTYSDTGLTSATAYSYTVTSYDTYKDATTSNSSSATATTVPATPSAPSATAGVNQDTVTWSAPANGGSTITGYIWASSDNKTNATGGTPGGGATASTSVTVAQEASTSQTYTVYAINANGNSGTSPSSNSVTTQAPSFFSPPGFFAPPGFFSPPGFFAPPGFFSPPAFQYKSVGVSTLVRTPNGMVAAGQLQVGDEIISLSIPGIPDDFREIIDGQNPIVITEQQMNEATEVVATIQGTSLHDSAGAVIVNTDVYSLTHFLIAKRDGVIQTILAQDLLPSDLIYKYNEQNFIPIENLDKNLEINIQVYTINVEPYDFYFTENGLTFDAYPVDWTIQPN